MSKITEKLKEVLSPEDLKTIEEGIQKMVDDEVALRVEEKTKELDEKAEEFCQMKIAEGVDKEKEALIAEYDKKMDELEDTMVERLDKFLEVEISEQISEETLKKIAINESLKPLVDGIKQLFEEKYVELDSDGEKAIADSKEEIQQLKDQNSDLMAEKIELAKLAEGAAIKLLISDKTVDLTETQKDRVSAFCEGKTFEDVQEKIDRFVAIVEDDTEDKGEELNEEEEKDKEKNFSDEDGIDDSDKDDLNEEEKKEQEEEEKKEKAGPYADFLSSANKLL